MSFYKEQGFISAIIKNSKLLLGNHEKKTYYTTLYPSLKHIIYDENIKFVELLPIDELKSFILSSLYYDTTTMIYCLEHHKKQMIKLFSMENKILIEIYENNSIKKNKKRELFYNIIENTELLKWYIVKNDNIILYELSPYIINYYRYDMITMLFKNKRVEYHPELVLDLLCIPEISIKDIILLISKTIQCNNSNIHKLIEKINTYHNDKINELEERLCDINKEINKELEYLNNVIIEQRLKQPIKFIISLLRSVKIRVELKNRFKNSS